MKIALIGATGFIGSAILFESLKRGHDVTAIVRSTGDLPGRPGLTPVQGDVTEPDRLAQLLAGHDVVISAFNPGKDATGTGAKSIIDAAKRSEVPRLLVVGGAGTLEVAPGQRLVDQPSFPQEWKEGALRTADVLDQLRAEPELDWVFVSPAAVIAPGERTGRYRIGGDQLLTDSNGESRISTADYASAMLDEVEEPQHARTRISVAY